jgi:hypothetical protein
MLAKIIKAKFQDAMGSTLDLIRISDIGERQMRQLTMTIKNRWNEELVALLSSIEEMGLIKRCDCLNEILASKALDLPSEKIRELYDRRDSCEKCGGSGYMDSFEIQKEEEK